jgi:hypothetical protein
MRDLGGPSSLDAVKPILIEALSRNLRLVAERGDDVSR